MKRRKREVVSAKAGEKWDVLFPGPVGKVVNVEIQKPCARKRMGIGIVNHIMSIFLIN